MSNLGRNGPCPCGSGRKYKQCCETKPARLRAADLPPGPDGEPHFIAELSPEIEEEVNRLLQRIELGEGRALKRDFADLVRKAPRNHAAQYAMGAYLATVENSPDRALPYFSKAVAIFPPFPEAHFNLATCHMKMAHIAQAVHHFREAKRYAGKDDEVAKKAADELARVEEIVCDGSLSTLDEFVANQQLFDEAFGHMSAGRFGRGIELFTKVLEKNPRHPQSYGNMGMCYAKLGHKAKALECLDKALEIDPAYAPARLNKEAILGMTEGQPLRHLKQVTTEFYLEQAELEAGKPRPRSGLRALLPW